MVQSPSWPANCFAASQEIPLISRNPKIHYRIHKGPSPVPILGQPNPVYIPTSHHLEIHPNIIHPSTPRSPQWSPFLRFPHQDHIHPLSSPIRATCPVHLILLDFEMDWACGAYSTYMFAKSSNTKFHENPSPGSRVDPCGRTDRQTDMTKLRVAFRSFANAPKKRNVSLNVKYTSFVALSASGGNAPDQLRHGNHFITFLYFRKPRVCINRNNAAAIHWHRQTSTNRLHSTHWTEFGNT